MLRCFGFTRKRLTRGSSKAKEGSRDSPAWDGACTAVSKRVACLPCSTGLWLHIDFKGNVTQIPSEVRLMLVFYVCCVSITQGFCLLNIGLPPGCAAVFGIRLGCASEGYKTTESSGVWPRTECVCCWVS